MRNLSIWFKWLTNNRFYSLFIFLFLFILLPPFLIHLPYLSFIIYIILSLIVLNCVVILFEGRGKSEYGVIALLISLVFIWLSLAQDWQNTFLQVIRMVVLMLLFKFTLFRMIKEILWIKQVTAKVIFSAIGAYLLLGIIGTFLFEIVELMYPNSFTKSEVFTGFYGEIYFSFVTISTLGYGDITPLTPQGQSVAIIMAVAGQLFIAILMAMLVGKFLADKQD